MTTRARKRHYTSGALDQRVSCEVTCRCGKFRLFISLREILNDYILDDKLCETCEKKLRVVSFDEKKL